LNRDLRDLVAGIDDGPNCLMQLRDGGVEVVLHLLVFGGELLAYAIAEIALGQALEAPTQGVDHGRDLSGGRRPLPLVSQPRLVGDPLLLGACACALLSAIALSLNTCKAAAMSPISSVRSRSGTAVSSAPLARSVIAPVSRRNGLTVRFANTRPAK